MTSNPKALPDLESFLSTTSTKGGKISQSFLSFGSYTSNTKQESFKRHIEHPDRRLPARMMFVMSKRGFLKMTTTNEGPTTMKDEK